MHTYYHKGVASFFTLLCLTLDVVAGESNSLPNIVLILADDLGYGDLGCYPKDPANVDAPAISPHIDSLAAQGVKFTTAYSMPMCSPARAALLTGRYPARFGFYGNADAHVGLPRTERLLSEVLKARGYATACIGKWHVGHLDGHRPLDRGFDRFYGFLGASHDYFKTSLGTDTDGAMYEGSWIWDQDKKVEKIKYLTDQFTDEAITFIAQAQQRKQPFFLYLPYNAPHGPEQATAQAIQEFSRYPQVKNQPRTVVRAMIDAMDQNIGRLQRELFLRGLDGNTIIVFASDNGGNEYEEPTGIRTVEHNGGLRGRKFTLWNGGVRVPLIIRWPEVIGKGVVYNKPVLLLDMYATLSEAAGVSLPTNRPLDSVNLLPFVRHASEQAPHPFIYSFMPDKDTWCIRQGDWKLVNDWDSLFIPGLAPTRRETGLFNLAEDSGERINRLRECPAKADELRALHLGLRKEFLPSLADERKKRPETGKVIEVDLSTQGRVFEGVGTLSAGASSRLLIDYPEPYRSDILDYLFKPNFGASQHHIKVEIGADANSTIGSEPSHARTRAEIRQPNFRRGYEYWLMREAKKRNPAIMTDMLEWGAPSWFSNDYGHVTAFFSRDNADYIASALKGAQSEWDVKVDFTGVWNEGPYSRYPAKDIQDWMVNIYRPTLDRQGLKGTRLVAMDANKNQWFVVEWMKENKKLYEAIDIVGEHYPGGQSMPAARQLGKPLWANEDAWLNDEWGGAVGMVKVCNRNYIDGKMTKTISWATVNSFFQYMWNCGYPGKMRADSPWSGHYEVRSPIWAMAHICQFVQPGWRYLDSGCGYLDEDKKNGTFVTLKAPDSNHYAVILETWGVLPKEVVFRIAASAQQEDVCLWESTEKEQFVRKGVLKPLNGELRVKLESNAIYTLTTTTGQRKGVAAHPIPEEKPFPLPYCETFDGCEVGVTPRYLANYSGAFETAPGDQGMVLRQVVLQRPIDWTYGGNHYPQVFVGGGDWTNYEVSCEVRLADSSSVALYGRVKGVYRTSMPPKGYGLYLYRDGRWEIKFETDPSGKSNPLAAGVAGPPGAVWHKLALRFVGQTLSCLIDGQGVASLQTPLSAAGAVGLGCDWGAAEFDNLRVEPLAGPEESAADKGTEKARVEAIRISSENGADEIIKKNAKLRLVATVLPEQAAAKTVRWSVFDSGMRDTLTATITQEGVLTVRANGMYKVQAESTNNTGVRDVFTVNVSGQD